MSLIVPQALITELEARAAASPGTEICGLLLGAHNRVEAIEPARNVAANPATHFEIDPAVLIAAHRRARDGELSVIGHYHSHPNGRIGPSPADEAMAAGDGAYWLILSGDSMSAWLATDKGLVPQPILPC